MLLKDALVKVGKNGDLVATAPQRRKVKRATEMLDKFIGARARGTEGRDQSQEENIEEDDMVVVHNPKPGLPLEDAIRAVNAASSGEELLDAVKEVRPGSGNNKSRRTLLRALTAILSDDKKGLDKRAQ